SIGGGNVNIININGNEVSFTGDYPTILAKYKDRKGVISEISTILSNHNINIATMNVTRENKIATMITELDSPIDEKIIKEISSSIEMIYITAINPIKR
ncbi:MAG: ACT domain-containing protein, partial [Tissierellales bacterium]